MLLSVLYVRFRDIQPIWDVTAQILFYASPIIYTAKTYPASVGPHRDAQPDRHDHHPDAPGVHRPHGALGARGVAGGAPRLLIPLGIIVAVVGARGCGSSPARRRGSPRTYEQRSGEPRGSDAQIEIAATAGARGRARDSARRDRGVGQPGGGRGAGPRPTGWTAGASTSTRSWSGRPPIARGRWRAGAHPSYRLARAAAARRLVTTVSRGRSRSRTARAISRSCSPRSSAQGVDEIARHRLGLARRARCAIARSAGADVLEIAPDELRPRPHAQPRGASAPGRADLLSHPGCDARSPGWLDAYREAFALRRRRRGRLRSASRRDPTPAR